MARNFGAEKSEGKYIMFVDSDDHIAHDSLGEISAMCNDNPDMVRFCAANVMEGEIRRRFSYNDCTPAPGRQLMKGKFQVCAPFAVYRKGFLETNDLKFLPGIYHEDNEFTPRAYYAAQRVASTDRIIYFVRQTPQSITRTPNPKRGYDLLKVIDMLCGFAAEKAEAEYRPYLYKQAADCINSCLRLMDELTADEAAKLLDEMNKGRDIAGILKLSSARTHRTEGLLMKIFPKRMKTVHRILESLRR
jgi:glycosyltransferase involved in cell wall biosynthesis